MYINDPEYTQIHLPFMFGESGPSRQKRAVFKCGLAKSSDDWIFSIAKIIGTD